MCMNLPDRRNYKSIHLSFVRLNPFRHIGDREKWRYRRILFGTPASPQAPSSLFTFKENLFIWAPQTGFPALRPGISRQKSSSFPDAGFCLPRSRPQRLASGLPFHECKYHLRVNETHFSMWNLFLLRQNLHAGYGRTAWLVS